MSVFRELFVEVPIGLLEAAVVKAQAARLQAEIVDYLLGVIDRGAYRRCRCGVPQGLGPAGKGTP